MTRAARIGAWAGALVAASTRPAFACPSCLASGYGDRTFNLAHLWMFVVPFAIMLTIGGIFAWHAGWRLRVPRRVLPFQRTKETT